MRRVVFFILPLVLVGFLSRASADTASVEDPRDTGDVMDLAEATHGHDPDQKKVLVHTLATHDAWSNEEFVRADLNFWGRKQGHRFRRVLVVTSNPDGSFVASVYRAGSQHEVGDFLGYGNAFRSDDRTLVIQLPKRLLKRGLDRYKWKAFLQYPCSRTAGVTCSPPPPDTHIGRILHVLG